MVVLTGATGHLGSSLLRQLSARGDSVRATVRPSSDKGHLRLPGVEVVEAPLDDLSALTRAFEGADIVIHAAALIDTRRGFLNILRKVNVEGTARVIEACRIAQVRRLVYVSSIEAFDVIGRPRPIRETHGLAVENSIMEYGITKAEATRLVLEAAGRGEIDACAVCPSSFIGPWDYKSGYMTQLFKNYLARKVPAWTGGGCDYFDVRDLAEGTLAAAERGRTGELYLMGHDFINMNDFFDLLEEVSGVPRPKLKMPEGLVKAMGSLVEGWSRVTGASVLFTRNAMDYVYDDMRIDSGKARRELGYVTRPLKETVTDIVSWIRDGVEPDPAGWAEVLAARFKRA